MSTADLKPHRSLLSRFGDAFLGILAPPGVVVPDHLLSVRPDQHAYESLLSAIQRFRGSVYVADGAIPASELDDQGRHFSITDFRSWHVYLLDQQFSMAACARLRGYPETVGSHDLYLAHTLRRLPADQRSRYEAALQVHLDRLQHEGKRIAEVGGLAVDPQARGGTKTVILIAACWALMRALDSPYWGLSTTTLRYHANELMRRFGAYPLEDNGVPLPPFFDSFHQCDLELLVFDPSRPCTPAMEPTVAGMHRFLLSYFLMVPQEDKETA